MVRISGSRNSTRERTHVHVYGIFKCIIIHNYESLENIIVLMCAFSILISYNYCTM